MSLRLDTLCELVAEYPAAIIHISAGDREVAIALLTALQAALIGDKGAKIVADQSLSDGSLMLEAGFGESNK